MGRRGAGAPAGHRVLLVDHRDSLSRTTWRRLAELAGGTSRHRGGRHPGDNRRCRWAGSAIAGELVEIRARDLRWTEPEMRALLQRSGLDLGEKEIDLLGPGPPAGRPGCGWPSPA